MESKKAREEDLKFLSTLDAKLHCTYKSTFMPNMSEAPFGIMSDGYKDASMGKREVERIFKAIERGNFAFYPLNTAMGFCVGFRVADPENGKALLTFKESQLPKNYDFERLSEYFMKPENIERAKLCGTHIINDRGHYEY